MGLRCSLLGHEYDDVTVERDREERGNEVVITERELQECTRCGSEKVISENTEVRSLESEPEPEPASGMETELAAGEDPDSTSEPGFEPDAGAESAGSDDVGSFADDEFEPPASPETDDAVILDEEDDEREGRQPGQWPETDDHRQDQSGSAAEPESSAAEPADTVDAAVEDEGEVLDDGETEVIDAESEESIDAGRDTAAEEAATAWPDHDGEDRGYDAEPDESDFQFGSESISSDDIEAAAEESATESDDTEFVEGGTGMESGSGITSAGPFEESDADTIETVLVCPECGLEREAAGSSLRAGDICPECKRGYLAER